MILFFWVCLKPDTKKGLSKYWDNALSIDSQSGFRPMRNNYAAKSRRLCRNAQLALIIQYIERRYLRVISFPLKIKE